MRLIDADALAKVLNDLWLLTSSREHDDKETAFERAAMCRGIDDCIKYVHDSTAIGGWISVKDKMPEEHPSMFAPWYGGSRWTKAMWRKESDNVLLAYKTPDAEYVVKEGHTHDGKFHSGNIVLDNHCEVTHWMEMPTPPKEDEQNDA